MANEQNLKPFTSEQSREEAVKNGQKGGIASGKSRNLKSLLIEALENGGYELMRDVAFEEIKAGNAKFWELVRDTAGEKPVDKQEIELDMPDITLVKSKCKKK